MKSFILGNHVIMVYGTEVRNNKKYLRIADPNLDNSHYPSSSSLVIYEGNGMVLYEANFFDGIKTFACAIASR